MISDTTTNIAAAGALVSPFWIPRLSELSTMAAEILPILGAVWLIVQILSRIYSIIASKKEG